MAAATLLGTGVAACAGAASEAPAGTSTESASTETAAPAASPAGEPPLQTATPIAPGTFDGDRAWTHLTRQVALGPRPSGTAPLAATRTYILEQLKAAGITAREQSFVATTPAGQVRMSNVIATLPGTRPERLVLASHFDTKIAPNFRFVGANDGASSTAALLEIGRVLAGRPRQFTIELLFLDGEEAVNWNWEGTDNTYGSRYYVEAARRDGSLAGIAALILLDMIGDRDLVIRRDSYSTPWLVDILWATAARLGHAGTFSNELTTIDDDHVPFLRAGVPAVDIIDLDNPTWHTAEDDLAHVNVRSLQIVGDVVLAALPAIEQRAAAGR